ncbi:hypothetical protein LCGC14_3055760, partial [marine sediment metagenome]
FSGSEEIEKFLKYASFSGEVKKEFLSAMAERRNEKLKLFAEKLPNFKVHKYALDIDVVQQEKLIGWPSDKGFKLPLKITGTAITEGPWRGMSGEWVYYPAAVIKRAAGLLTGCQVRVDHADDGSPLNKVIGWVTKSWFGKAKNGKNAIKYKGLIFDHEMAEKVINKKIRKVSVSPFVRESVEPNKGLVANDIKAFEEISILSENNPACRDADVAAV